MQARLILVVCLGIWGCDSDAGKDGEPGSSCSVVEEAGQSTIRCTDGTKATVNDYTDEDAVNAMGNTGHQNSLNHGRYTDEEALAAVSSAGFADETILQAVADELAALQSCPIDMINGGEFCIEIDERAPNTDIAQAARACRLADRRLCSFEEWFYACNDIAGLNDMIGNFEGSSNMYISGALVTLGSGGNSCGNVEQHSGPVAFRCCSAKL